MKKKLCIILVVLVLLGGLLWAAYDFATDVLVKKTLHMISEDTQLKADVDAAINSFFGKTDEMVDVRDETERPNDSGNMEEQSDAVSPKEEEPQANNAKTSKNNVSKPSKRNSSSQKTAEKKQQDEGLSIDNLKPNDKDYVMSIYKRFSASEISQVSGMLSGGLTAEEKKTIKSIVYAKVSQSEVSKLLSIANKYQ